MKINTLLDLWKHWCNICSAEQEKNGDIPGSIMNDVIRPNNRLAECLDIIEHISKPEEYCTQILCGLLNQIEDFQFEFLKKIGVIHEENRKKFKPYLVKAEHPVYKLENGRKKLEYKYDISFWLKDEEEKLICIVEVKIDANFQNNQLKNYLEILENCDNGKALVLLTKYNMNSYKEVTDIFEPTSRNKVIFANVFWYEIVELIKCYCDKYNLAWQAFELFTSEYFLFQEKGVSQVGEKFEREFFIDKIKEICDNTDNKIVYHEHGSFKKRCITLLTSRYGEKNWYGGLLALNIWLDGYLITDKYEDVDADLPKQLKSKAYPFFDIVIKCYYQVENHDIRKEDLITIKQFSENDYEDFCIYDKKNTKKIKHKLFRKSLSEKIRISDKKTLDDEIKNLDSAVWKWLKKEIFKWQEIVCDNKS